MHILRKYDRSKKRPIFFNLKSKKKIPYSSELYKRLSHVYIPPAYKNVKMTDDLDANVLAIGTDSKNRPQYIYSKKHTEEQKVIKFKDLLHFGRKIKRIRKDCVTLLKKCIFNSDYKNRDCVIALIIHLIDKCNFRVGNDKYRQLYNSYGITTINATHVKKMAQFYKIEFVGKKGVINSSYITNRYVNIILAKLCKLYRNDKFLFQYYDNKTYNISRITEKHINDFLKKYHKTITVKMFRTWNANYLLLKELMHLKIPKDEKEAKKNINMAITKAAKHLHHTKAVSKTSYMNNDMIDIYISKPNYFYQLIAELKKSNGSLPTIDRILNIILKKINS
jgi:DNA topoisomerase I